MHDHFREVCEQRGKVSFVKTQFDDTCTSDESSGDETTDEEFEPHYEMDDDEIYSNSAMESRDFPKAPDQQRRL